MSTTVSTHPGRKARSNASLTFFVCFLAALAGLLFGLDIGVIAGALPFISETFQITSSQQEWVVSSMMFGAAVGAVGSGWLNFRIGRKYSLMIGAVLFVVGSLCSAFAPDVEILIVSRVLLGLAVGIASYTAPIYLSEIAPEKIRGSMISMYQLMITIGILAAYLSDTAFSYTGAWRWMLGVITIPAVLLLIGVFFLPDSPRWLAARGSDEKARRVLEKLRDTSEQAKNELDEIRESLKVKQRVGIICKQQKLPPCRLSGCLVTGDAAVHRYERHHVLRTKNLRFGRFCQHFSADVGHRYRRIGERVSNLHRHRTG